MDLRKGDSGLLAVRPVMTGKPNQKLRLANARTSFSIADDTSRTQPSVPVASRTAPRHEASENGYNVLKNATRSDSS
jgi:hypothetical protein